MDLAKTISICRAEQATKTIATKDIRNSSAKVPNSQRMDIRFNEEEIISGELLLGPDQVIFELLHNQDISKKAPHFDADQSCAVDVDMSKVYLDARFLSQVEAAYRLLAFPTQYSMYTVISPIPHLSGQEPVFFKDTPAGQVAPVSRLLAYFSLAERGAHAAGMTWIEVAEQFRCKGRRYIPYKRKGRRGCIWFSNLTITELFALRKFFFVLVVLLHSSIFVLLEGLFITLSWKLLRQLV
ncbi:hypothetical protein ANCCEY_06109 [Ancylostoma ceylanicum]|uniref:Uncharacterized protein n=1 Tax=Ancylostoma ceylanicum TaxID=53326 RepID=A0A0D6M4H7_9BILA|nr:hypothetical protein ANCCEY_06109 [Ancylostoma ceylanicum]